MAKKQDLAWEALVEVTNANEAMERGRLNTALRAIRLAWESEGGLPEDLHYEIPRRAEAYRKLWPSMALTPTALCTHWKRVIPELERKELSSVQGAIEALKKEDRDGSM